MLLISIMLLVACNVEEAKRPDIKNCTCIKEKCTNSLMPMWVGDIMILIPTTSCRCIKQRCKTKSERKKISAHF